MTPRLLPVAILMTFSGCCIPPLPRFLPPGQLCLGLGPIYRPYPGFAAPSGFGPGPAVAPYAAHSPSAFPAPEPTNFHSAAFQDSGPLVFGRRLRARPPGHPATAGEIQPVAWSAEHSHHRLPRHAQHVSKHRTAISDDSGCQCEHCERRRRASRNCGCERCRRSRATHHHAGRFAGQQTDLYSDMGQPYYNEMPDTPCSDCHAYSGCSECSSSGCGGDPYGNSHHSMQNSWSTEPSSSNCDCQTHASGTTYYPTPGSPINSLPIDATQPDLNPVPQPQKQEPQAVPKPRPLPDPPPAPPAAESPAEMQDPMPMPMAEPQPTTAAGIPMSEWANLPVEELSMNKLSARKATSIRQISYEMVTPFEAEEIKVENDEIPGQRVMLKTIQ